MNWNEFFDMGGYAFYVWSSWGLSLLIIILLMLEARLANVKIRRQLKRRFTREETFKPHQN